MYIKREAVLKHKRKMQGEDWSGEFWDEAVLCEDICNIPAVDVVEVCRCKECDVPHNKWTGCPNLNGLILPPDFYCARGERKGGVQE